MTDEELLVQYRETGDRELFASLVSRYERELYNYLRRYLNDAEMAEDTFQAAFMQVHVKCHQFEAGRRFRPWLYTIATNQAIDAQRRNRRHKMLSLDRQRQMGFSGELGRLADMLESGDINPMLWASQLEDREWVEVAVKQLSHPMREVIDLVYYQGLKYREAAEMLDIPVGTVKSRLHAAVLKLTEIWKRTNTVVR